MGSSLAPGKHQIMEAREVEADGGLILECVRSGMLDSEGEVLRLEFLHECFKVYT